MTDTRAVCWEAISCLSGRAKGCGNVCKKVFGKPEVVEEEPFDGHFQFSKFLAYCSLYFRFPCRALFYSVP